MEFKSKFKSSKESPGFMLWQVTNMWQRRMRETLKPFDLTHVQFVILACIGYLQAMSKNEISQALISSQAKLDLMMTSQVVRTLEKKKLIVRTTSEKDSRAYALSMTDNGKNVLKKALKAVEEADTHFFCVLQNEGLSFLASLQKLEGQNE